MAIRRDFKEGMQVNGLCLIFGIEYTTPAGDFLLFGPFEKLSAGINACELLQQVKDTGGVAVAAHPFRTKRLTNEILIHKGLCRIVEGVNGRNSPGQNMKTGDWQRRYGVHLTGGSDAHSLEELGAAATRLTTPVSSREEFIRALLNRDFEEVAPGHPAAE